MIEPGLLTRSEWAEIGLVSACVSLLVVLYAILIPTSDTPLLYQFIWVAGLAMCLVGWWGAISAYVWEAHRRKYEDVYGNDWRFEP